MKHRMLQVVVALVVIAATGCEQRPRALNDEEVAAVREVFENAQTYINAGDFAAWANELFTERAMLMPPNQPTVRGREAIRAWGEEGVQPSNVSFTDIEVRGAGDLAWGSSAYSVEFGGVPDSGKQLVVLVRQDEARWWVVAASFNSDLPLPESPES